MFRLILACAAITAVLAGPVEKSFTPEELAQNRNARYAFSTNIEDHISDLTHERSEVREGLLVRGNYGYSDGYFRHFITYEADEHGYRILKDEVTPLAGPKPDLSGKASVSTKAHGSEIVYVVRGVPVV